METISTEAHAREPAVLEDASGRSARWMRRAGRAVFVLFLAWFAAIVLGGLGLVPLSGIPFGHVLQPSLAPPAVTSSTALGTAAAGRPASWPVVDSLSNGSAVAAARQSRTSARPSPTPAASPKPPAGGTVAPGQTRPTPPGAVVRGQSSTAPGQTRPTPPGAVTRGHSGTAPGQMKPTPAPVIGRV